MSLPSLNEKVLNCLSSFMIRISSMNILDFQTCKNIKSLPGEQVQKISTNQIDSKTIESSDNLFQQSSNLLEQVYNSNFEEIINQFEQIGISNLEKASDTFWVINDAIATNQISDLKTQITSVQTTEINNLEKQLIEAKTSEKTKTLTEDEEQQVLENLQKLKKELKPFVQVVNTIFNFLEKLLSNLNYYKEQKKSVEDSLKIKKNENEENPTLEKKQAIQHQEMELSFIDLIIKQQLTSIIKIQNFYTHPQISEFTEQVHVFLQANKLISQPPSFLEDYAKFLFGTIFDCFYPEMLLEINKVFQPDQTQNKPTDFESKYVTFEAINKIDTDIDADSSQDSQQIMRKLTNQFEKQKSKQSQNIFSGEISQLSAQLRLFNQLCQKNKNYLNKILKIELQGKISKELKNVMKHLFKMPHILSFENKQFLFNKRLAMKIRKKRNEEEEEFYMRLKIRRDNFLDDTFTQIQKLSKERFFEKLNIQFEGEIGNDVGGLTREFFNEFSKQIVDEKNQLFKTSANGGTCMPNPFFEVDELHIKKFHSIGRIIAKALYEECQLECYFIKSFYKILIRQPLSLKDIEDVDIELYNNLLWTLTAPKEVDFKDLCTSFSSDITNKQGGIETFDLIPNGREIEVTRDNKEYYVERKIQFSLYQLVQKQIDSFLDGFYQIIDRDLIYIFTHKEIELLISGQPDYDISDLKANTNYDKYQPDSQQIIWFWEVLGTLDRTQKCMFLSFATGSSKVPIGGFSNLKGQNGAAKFVICRVPERKDWNKPHAHTCSYTLDLPEYQSKEELEEELKYVIKEGGGFGLA